LEKKAICIALLLIIASFFATGNKLNTLQGEWNKTYGGDGYDVLYCVKETTDGGYIAVGDTVRNNVAYAWAIKTDGNGNLQWESVDVAGSYLATYVQETDDGYIVCGWIDTGGEYVGYVWKINHEGKTEWIKEYDDVAFLYKIMSIEDGYICIGGTKIGENDYDGILMKIGYNGNVEWKKIYRYSYGWDVLRAISKIDGGYIMGGACEVNGYGDFWIMKIDDEGNMIWQTHYGGDKFDGIYARDCFETNDGGYIFGGFTYSYGKNSDVWIVKIDDNGKMIWNKTYGGSRIDRLWGMDKASEGYLLCITKNYGVNIPTADIWIVKIDENGDMLWNQTFGSKDIEDRGYYIQATMDGGYIIAARTGPTSGDTQGWLIKVENTPPNKPSPPQGEANGKINREYTYTTSTIDSNGDEVYYMFDWRDNTTSEWIGPFKSGETINASHAWKEEGTYKIRVKAKDVNGLESPWSDYTVVSMPKGITWKLEKFPFIYLLLKFFFSFFSFKL